MSPSRKTPSKGRGRPLLRRGAAVVLAVGLAAGELTGAPAFGAPPTSAASAAPLRQGTAADFGPSAATSSDLAVTAVGDGAGYHIQVSHEKAGFAWHEIAVLKPAGMDEATWTGYQCTSGDGRFEAVTVAPASAANSTAGREHGAFAYSVDLTTGRVQPIASGVALQYHSPGCGTGEQAEFSVGFGNDQQSTEILSADLATGRIGHTTKVAGQVTSAVPTSQGVVGVLGDRLVAVPETGAATGLPQQIATVPGQPYDLRPAADGGIDFLSVAPGAATAHVQHEKNGGLTELGTGRTAALNLFAGRAGHNLVVGADQVAHGAAIRAIDTNAIADPQNVSVEGNAVFGAHQVDTRTDSAVLASATGKVVRQPEDIGAATAVTTATSSVVPEGVDRNALNSDLPASTAGQNSAPGQATAKTGTTVTPNTLQTPTCSVPRDNPTFQSMQQGSSQIDWAAQMAEQNLLTGSAYARPANFDNLGLVSYSPNGDFAAVPLSHPSTDTWSTVPRSVFEAIMAQESNWDQASWHALPGIAGNPVIADYYGAAGTIDTINYAAADCGYGISQVTTGMFASQTGQQYSQHGQWKIAVDYQENMAAGLQILERTWNSLYAAGITANGGDPRYLENWYFAIWAYNTGIQPDAKHGNTTGCTPGPTCTGPDGTWGLGWANNPANPSYPPNRNPYLAYTYADAAHPSSWPYQERVLGWMGTPLVRMGAHAYAQATFNGGGNWLNIPAFNTFCTSAGNLCNPGAAGQSGTCTLADYECWWHAPVTWIPTCSTTCSTSSYAVGSGSTEPSVSDPHPPVCSLDTGVVPTTSNGAPIIVAAQTGLAAGSRPLNIVGCSGTSNWSNGGTFAMTYGTNANGDPTGAVDTHQLGAGFGGYIMFDHTQDGTEPAVMNTGTWTPTLPSLQYYKIKLHLPATGATAGDVVYAINPGGSASPWKIRVNQDWGSDQWVTIGTFAMQNGATVQLSNQSAMNGKDVGYDAVAFLPQGGTPGTPIGGPPGVMDAPKGSNPSFVNCGCTARTAGDPIDTATGYFGQSVTDMATPGRGRPLSLSRSYASALADPAGPNGANTVNGPFGYGWTFSYGLSAATNGTTGAVTINQEDGSQVAFSNSSGTYSTAAPRYDATLAKNGAGYTFTRRGREIFTFDAATGRLTSESDPAGANASTPYATTLAYNGSGQLSTITDPAGHVYTLGWTGSHVTSLTDSAGRQVGYGYDTAGDLTDVYGLATVRTPTLQNNDHTTYTYNTANHLLTGIRQPKYYGDTTTSPTPAMSMVYDASERVSSQTDATGHVTTFTYGPSSSPSLSAGQTLVTDPAGHQRLDTYQNGLLVSETAGYGSTTPSTTTYTYDPVTLGVSTVSDPNGDVETFSYDDHGNKISASNGLGYTTAYTYNAMDELTAVIDPLGVKTTYGYDEAGHIAVAGGTNNGALTFGVPTSQTVAQLQQSAEISDLNPGTMPSRTTAYYDDDAAHPGDRTRAVDGDTNTVGYAYDAYGNRISATNAAGDTTKYGYNTGLGELTSTVTGNGVAAGVVPGCTPPAHGCTVYTYDAYGRPLTTTDALGHVEKKSYDANGNQISSTDGNNNTTAYAYDPDNHGISMTNPDRTVSHTDYNPNGTVADSIDASNAKTVYGYDAQGRKTSQTDPDNHVTGYGYDPDGNLTTVTNPAGKIATTAFNAANQPASVTYSDGVTPKVAYGYNADGWRTSMIDGTGTTTWAYDAFGEIAAQTNGAGATVSYGYDNNGNATAITYPGGTQTVNRTFDKANRLATVTDWNSQKTVFGYDADSDLKSTTYPNGVVVSDGYDNADHPSSDTAAKAGATLASVGYSRDTANQISATTPTGLPDSAQSITYTAQEQVKTVTVGSTATGYAYDAAGKPTTVAGSAQGFDAAGQLCWTLPGTATSGATCAAAPTGATTYSYNSSGDRTGSTPASGTASGYTYNEADQLTGSTGPNGSAAYTYNGQGLRTSKTVGTVTTRFTWDVAQVADLLSDGTDNWVYGPGGLAIEQVSAGSTLWFFHDALGSTRALLDGTGAVVGAYGYSTYGAVTGHSGTAATPLQFDGDYTDPETGMIYLHARYYDPATGQFLSVDPALAATGTPYGYSSDNPVNLTDNSGQCPWCLVTSIVGAVVGGGGSIINQEITKGSVDWTDVGIATVGGAVGGFAAGACGACGFEVAAGVNAAVGGAVDFGESYLEQAHNNAVQEGANDWASFDFGGVDMGQAFAEGLTGGAASGIGTMVGNVFAKELEGGAAALAGNTFGFGSGAVWNSFDFFGNMGDDPYSPPPSPYYLSAGYSSPCSSGS